MTETHAAISIENMSKNYGDVLAVDNLSLSIAPGEIFTCLGPNGAGKTTTIKVMTGLLRPTKGRARIMGYDIQLKPVEAKRHIGYIPDHPYLYEKLTGRDFFFFVADMFGVDRNRAAERMEELFYLFRLDNATNQLIENYSHGMRQKLVFSVALMHEPQVLVVDEPMVGLDPQSARTLKMLLKREAVNRGAAIFLSTHTLSIAEELADRVGIMHRGNLIFQGTLPEMRQRIGSEARSLEDMFLILTGEELAPEQIAAASPETVTQ